MDKVPMTTHEYELAKYLANSMLNFRIDYNFNEKIRIELGGNKWEFEPLSDAQIIEEISKIWTNINYCMWELINAEIIKWIYKNKQNFN